jgi:hypothetical protein
MKKYYVITPETLNEGLVDGPYSLQTAKDYARIGSQYGKRMRVIMRGRNGALVRIYHKGKRVYPTTRLELRYLTRGERPKVL